MAEITINATKRTVSGKPVAKLRKAGKIPAVVYGHNVKSENIELSESEFVKAFKKAGESTIVNLAVDGKVHPVLIHDVHNHYLKDNPIHVDFYAVNMSEKLTATVAIHFEGESQAVKNLGGTLVKNLSEVEVECLPADLPSHFTVDISALKTFEDEIRVSNIEVSDKVQILAKPEEVVVTVTPPRSDDELKGLDEKPVAADVTTVEGVVKPEEPVEGAAPAAEPEAKKE
jgi:large subunit ribosomal protein L25